MNIPPVQNNVVQSAVTVALGVVCFVFAVIEILIEILFPPVRRERRDHHRRRMMQRESWRVNSITPMFPHVPPPRLEESEIVGIELEIGGDVTPEEVV